MQKPHKKLVAWKQAMDLSVEIFALAQQFPREQRFCLADQMRRAGLSIPSNIAEGAARQSRKEFVKFLHTARGSLSELDTQLELAKRLGYLEEDQWSKYDDQAALVDRLISGLIRHQTHAERER